MSGSVELKVSDVSIAAIQAQDDKISPYVRVVIDKIEDRDKILLAEDIGNESSIPLYYITDVEVGEEGPSQAKVTARIGTPFFEEEPDLEETEEDLKVYQDITITLPLQTLIVSFTLSNAPNGGMPILVTREAEKNSLITEADLSKFADFSLGLPPEESNTYRVVLDKVARWSARGFTAPLDAHAFHAETTGDEVVPEARMAQFLLFSIYDGLAKGHEFSVGRLLHIVDLINENIKPETKLAAGTTTAEGTKYMDLAFFSTVAAEAYRRSFLATDGLEKFSVPPVEMTHGTDDEENAEEYDQHFLDIIQSEGLLDMADDLPSLRPRESNPFENGFPESMKKLELMFSAGGPASRLGELISSDGVTAHTMTELLETYTMGEYVGALVVMTAARAVMLAAQAGPDDDGDKKVTHFTAHWLSFEDDPYLWELQAMSKSVADYDMESFVELIGYSEDSNDEMGPRMPYFLSVLHELGNSLYEEGWTPDRIEERLAALDITFPGMDEVRNTLHSSVKSLEAEELEEVDCPGHRAIIMLVSSTDLEDLSKKVSSVAWSIPVLADLNAAEKELEVGSEEWRKFKMRYISDFFGRAAAN